MSVTHVYKEWLIFQSLTYVAKCDSLFLVWLILASATILMSVTHVYKEWLILPTLAHLAKCDPFFPVWLML